VLTTPPRNSMECAKCGGWEDTRSPEEIITEIYAARTVSHRAESLGSEETA